MIKYLEENGFYLLREGSKHSIYTNNSKTIPIKRHRTIDRITANELCKQAGLKPKFWKIYKIAKGMIAMEKGMEVVSLLNMAGYLKSGSDSFENSGF